MKISSEMNKLKENDICSLMLFALYKMQDIPEYSTLSELAYTLDLKSLLKLCEYFGGIIIKIPTLDELELIINALILYQQVNLDNEDFEKAIASINYKYYDLRKLKETYIQLCDLMKDYTFLQR